MEGYLALKVVYTEHADLDKIEASFPQANTGEGGMVGFCETPAPCAARRRKLLRERSGSSMIGTA